MNQVVSHVFYTGKGSTHNQCQSSSALSVNEEQSRDSEDDLNSTITEGCIQCLGVIVPGLFENGRTVEGDNYKMLEESCAK